MDVAVSDITYVHVENHWYYFCLFIDLGNQEIIGYSSYLNKESTLVPQAFPKINTPLHEINMFHSNYGMDSRVDL